VECSAEIASMMLCASSMMTIWFVRSIPRDSLVARCNSNGYGNVTI
jgi:hypothetical protein